MMKQEAERLPKHRSYKLKGFEVECEGLGQRQSQNDVTRSSCCGLVGSIISRKRQNSDEMVGYGSISHRRMAKTDNRRSPRCDERPAVIKAPEVWCRMATVNAAG